MRDVEAKIETVFQRLVSAANQRNRRARLILKVGVFVLFIGFLTASFFGNVDNVIVKCAAFAIVILLGSLFQFSRRIQHVVFNNLLNARDHRVIRRTALEFGIDPDEAMDRIAYAAGEFVLQS